MVSPQARRRQRGFALIEALVSLAILALGLLGLAVVQGRMLVETRTTNARAAAIRLVGDLSERVRINPIGANPPATPAGSLSAYSDDKAASFQGAVTAGKDCATDGPCSPAEQAAYDRAIWRTKVASSLPGGKSSIWQISPRQLQVVIAWQANENTSTTLSDAAPPAAARQVAQPLQISGETAGTMCGASSGAICHIDVIAIAPR